MATQTDAALLRLEPLARFALTCRINRAKKSGYIRSGPQIFIVSAVVILTMFLAMPLAADISVVGDDASLLLTDPQRTNVGVDFQAFVYPDGMVHYGFAQLSDSATWTFVDSVSPDLPVGSTINFATFAFTDPTTFLIAYPDNSLQLTAAASSTINSVGFSVYCGNGIIDSYGGGPPPPNNSVTFVPCSSSFLFYPYISGTASVELNGWTIPTEPGTYEDALFMGQTLNYSLTVDYTPPDVVPEPGFFCLLGLVTGTLAIIRIKRLA